MPYEPIPGQPQHATDEETMSVIRAVLTEAEEPEPTRKATRTARRADKAQGAQSRAFVEKTTEPNPRRRADDLPPLQACPPEDPPIARARPMAKAAGVAVWAVSAITRPVRAFRPTTRHLALASLALLIALRPHWFVISGVAVIAIVVGAFLIIGSDRIWRMVLAYLNRTEVRNPARAARLRVRLDRFAWRWDGILDWFPDGMADALYMPDFQGMQNADAAHTDAMSKRLTRMAHDT